MKRLLSIVAGLVVVALTVVGCGTVLPGQGWVSLIDGDKGLENFNRTGEANWRAEGGAIVADKGKGNSYLVSKNAYANFQLRVEFWAEPTTNSGVHIRVQDPSTVTDKTSYEANIFDQRPDPTFGTGGIVHFAKVIGSPKAGGQWNTYEITAKGSHIVVMLNGVRTAELNHNAFTRGPIALQYGVNPGGAIKWRKVQVREL